MVNAEVTGTHHNLENEKSCHRPCKQASKRGKQQAVYTLQTAGCSSGSKSSRLITVKYFANWVSGKSVGCWHFSTGVLNCLDLEAQDRDNKGKTKTKTVKILPRDEAVPRGFPSLPVSQSAQFSSLSPFIFYFSRWPGRLVDD